VFLLQYVDNNVQFSDQIEKLGLTRKADATSIKNSIVMVISIVCAVLYINVASYRNVT